MWFERLAAGTRAYEPKPPGHSSGYLAPERVQAWNGQPWVRRWARARLCLVYVSSAFSIAVVIAVALGGAAPSMTSTRLLYAINVVSFLVEAATHGGTMWLTRPERRLPFWPLFDWAILRRLSEALLKRRAWNDALVYGLTLALLGSLCVPLETAIFRALLGGASLCLLLLCLADGVRLSYVAQWVFILPAFLCASPAVVVRLALSGVYFWSGLSKVLDRSFYRDTAPEFFSPLLRLLTALRVPGRTLVLRTAAAFGVLAETSMGGLFAWITLFGASGVGKLLTVALVFNALMHGYIVLIVRLRGLWNWNLACLALAQVAFAPAVLAHALPVQAHHAYHVLAVLLFLIFPITAFIGHGSWGRAFSFQFYVHSFEGESWVIVHRAAHCFAPDQCATAFIGPDPVLITADADSTASSFAPPYSASWELARVEQQYEPYAALLDRLAADEPRGAGVDLNELARQLGLAVTGVQTAKQALLRETVAFDSNWIELEHCLERPFLQDEFASVWESPREWFWRFFLEHALRSTAASRPGVWVHKSRWTYRGHRSLLVRHPSK